MAAPLSAPAAGLEHRRHQAAITWGRAARSRESGTVAGFRELRRRRRMTQEQLAAAAGVSTVLISKLERDKRQSARIPTLQRLATGLDVPVSELIDRQPRLDGTQDGASVLALRDAIQSPADVPGLGGEPGGEPADVALLQRVADGCGRDYWTGDFTRLAATLPGLISAARQAPQGAEVLARAFDLAASLMVHLGKEDLAAAAAERAAAAACVAADELMVAAMDRGRGG